MNVSEKDEIIQSMSMLIKNFENKMDTRLSKIEKEVAQIPEMKSDISTMKSDISKMKDDISGSIILLNVQLPFYMDYIGEQQLPFAMD